MRIKNVQHVDAYKLKLVFGNNEVKIVDLEDKIKNGKGIFLRLRNLEYFKKVALDDSHLSICWPNGADFCPDVLYSMGKDVKKSVKSTVRRRKKKQAV